jgi:hypothetical protein
MAQLHYKDIVDYALAGMDSIQEGQEAADLHHELFNTGYFIVGTHEAKKWLEKYPGIFEAIETIKEYEQDNFGQVSTDLSVPEKVVNMFAYIEGEKLLQTSKTLEKRWNETLNAQDIEQIKKELRSVKTYYKK